jgi:hypothetical protein
VRIGIKNKEEKKRGKINEGDVVWVRWSVGKEKGGEKKVKNKGEKEKKSGNLVTLHVDDEIYLEL